MIRSDITPQKCPCCSNKNFSECCKNIISDHSLAVTPEMLMRSRYTAFVLHDIDYIMQTWDSPYRPETLNLDNCKWINLKILKSSDQTNNTDATSGTVTFSARYILSDVLFTMTEKSRFVKRGKNWYYQEGELKLDQQRLSRGQSCPCGSGKKYKRCCQK